MKRLHDEWMNCLKLILSLCLWTNTEQRNSALRLDGEKGFAVWGARAALAWGHLSHPPVASDGAKAIHGKIAVFQRIDYSESTVNCTNLLLRHFCHSLTESKHLKCQWILYHITKRHFALSVPYFLQNCGERGENELVIGTLLHYSCHSHSHTHSRARSPSTQMAGNCKVWFWPFARVGQVSQICAQILLLRE